jgi:RNA polymerase sigma-70 factor (ECF subfamily)
MDERQHQTPPGAMDEAELHQQLEQLHTLSYGWALNCCGSNPNDAEDILQTVYQRIFEGRARYDGRSAFKTWLFAVIRYTAAGERRRRWIRLLRLGGYQKEHERDSQSPDRGEAVEADEMAGTFRASLQKLPRRQSEVLHLVFYQSLTVENAAVAMGVSVGSARTHYDRGKRRLREILNETGLFDEYKQRPHS